MNFTKPSRMTNPALPGNLDFGTRALDTLHKVIHYELAFFFVIQAKLNRYLSTTTCCNFGLLPLVCHSISSISAKFYCNVLIPSELSLYDLQIDLENYFVVGSGHHPTTY